jgi:hypothetical protein
MMELIDYHSVLFLTDIQSLIFYYQNRVFTAAEIHVNPG